MHTQKQRIEYIDAAKALAIMLMIVGHCYWQGAIPHLRGFVYSFHMPLFFIISGMFIQARGLKESIIKYAKAYLRPYYITCILLLLILFLKATMNGKNYEETAYLWLIRTFFASGWAVNNTKILWANTPHIGALWFLFALFWASTIYSYMKLRLKKAELFLWVLIFFLISFYSIHYIRLPFSLQSGMNAILYLWVGDNIREHNLVTQAGNLNIVTKVVIILIALLSALHFGGFEISFVKYEEPVILRIFVSLILSISVFLLCKRLSLKGGWIGRSTLYILCAHVLSGPLLSVWGLSYRSLPYIPLANMVIEASAQIAIALLLAFAMKRCGLFKN